MSKQITNPWATGPAEILRHALSLLEQDTDTDRRIAIILVDNSVEQMLKSYLSLPKRITGISISRKRRSDAFESFPGLLDLFEDVASEKVEGLDLGVIEWYHRLRNELYHQGFGLTVEREKIEIYAELAKILYKNLFGEILEVPESDKMTLLGEFLENWNRLESAATALASEQDFYRGASKFINAIRFLVDSGILDSDEYSEINHLQQLRNSIVHTQADYRQIVNKKVVDRVKLLADYLEKTGDSL